MDRKNSFLLLALAVVGLIGLPACNFLGGGNDPLEVTIAEPEDGFEGETDAQIDFAAEATGGQSPYTFSWDFGDETDATGAEVSHAFAVAGEFEVTVTVTDNDGAEETASVNIVVEESIDLTDFALFTNPEGDFSTTDVRDVDGETIKFRISNQAIVYQDGTEYQAGQWPVTGNFLGGVAFQARFGTEDGIRQAYFTETGPATICDFTVTPATFSISATSQTVPQE